jgi:serine phosphatase RsbU (regulator of sigma subunit)
MAGLVLCFFYILAVDLDLVPLVVSGWYANAIPFLGALLLVITSSIQLSRQSAQTSRNLRRRLNEVETLTEEKVEEERRRKRLKAEYDRKIEELEEARRLQLSMLPQEMPALDGYELAAHMETAEEVGGDYYDFDLSENGASGDGAGGALTLAVGDATGHGLSAGTMVTATKSLFQAMGAEADLLPMLHRAGRALKKMNLRRLYMALTVARLRTEDGRLRLATAGMPPALVYRAASGEVETLRLKGMPLGSFPDFPYRERTLSLQPGDALLLMSDGFPERFNPEGEMLGYDRAAGVLAEAGHGDAEAIVDHFTRASDDWADGRPTDDDLTFVVLRRLPADGGRPEST